MEPMFQNPWGQTFSAWHQECDKQCWNKAGVGINDLPDWHWWDTWHDECSAAEAVELFLEEQGFIK